MTARVIPFPKPERSARIVFRRDGGIWRAFDGRGWRYISDQAARELTKLAAAIVAEADHALR
jgi:hypothetical protein